MHVVKKQVAVELVRQWHWRRCWACWQIILWVTPVNWLSFVIFIPNKVTIRLWVINIVNLKPFCSHIALPQLALVRKRNAVFACGPRTFTFYGFFFRLKSRWIVKILYRKTHWSALYRRRIRVHANFDICIIVLFNIVIVACGSCVCICERKKKLAN